MAPWRFCLLLGAALAGCVGDAVAQTASPGRPALWVVRDADTTVYLFGTIHMLKPGSPWFEHEVKAAFDRSAEVVLELVLPTPEQAQGTLLRQALAPGARPVAERLPADARGGYALALAGLGVPAGAFDPFQTWFAALTMTSAAAQQAGYDVAESPEVVLSRAAAAAGKPLSGLETFDEQLALMASMPESLQVRFLASTVAQLPDTAATLASMVDAWQRADPEALDAVMQQGLAELPEVAELLLLRRNVRWAAWIARRLETPGTVFVAVGAGHLTGAGSVQAELARHGLRAERVAR